MPPSIRPAVPRDAAALAQFGARAFAETFAHSTSAENLAAFLAGTYSAERQRAELLDPGIYVAVAEDDHATGALAGYVLLRAAPAPSCVHGPAPVELARIYTDSAFVGRGLGHALLEHARAEARRRGFRTLWLGVWEHNARALAFYGRHGFRDVGSHVFRVGADAQTDRLMACAP